MAGMQCNICGGSHSSYLTQKEERQECFDNFRKGARSDMGGLRTTIVKLTKYKRRLEFMQEHDVHINHIYGSDGYKWEIDWQEYADPTEGDTLIEAIDKAIAESEKL